MGLVVAGLIVVGLILGPVINFAIYAFAYFPRPISPWQNSPAEIGDRGWRAKLPVVGWLFRNGECKLFGRFFWIRPFLIEFGTPIALVFLHLYCMDASFMPAGLIPISQTTLWHQFIAFGLLISLMTVATFIDFDERTIPDLITIPGTLVGLVGAVAIPDWRLHEIVLPVFPGVKGIALPLQANSPSSWNPSWNGSFGLFLGLLFWSLWCFGMADRRWITRRGVGKAFVYFFEVLKRSPSTKMLMGLWLAGTLGLSVAYGSVGPLQWEALLSSLFGIGLGGGLVWGFRIVACWAMGQEALGFGDVTLMAMIGAFFGWQIVWIAFFLAPFFGMLFVVIVWIFTRDNSLPFGPYLCAATLYVMLDWVRFWAMCSGMFLPPELLTPMFLVMLLALGGLLWIVQAAKQSLGVNR
jgi:leader peptidase (prepilin peptidase) / N-methyltransferase